MSKYPDLLGLGPIGYDRTEPLVYRPEVEPEPEAFSEVERISKRIISSERRVNVLNIGIKNALNLNNLRGSDLVLEEGVKELMEMGNEFYKVTLVADFKSDRKWKFVNANIIIHIASQITKEGFPKIYSIAPERVEEKTKKTKKYGVSPSMKLSEVLEISGGEMLSYTEEYEAVTESVVGHYYAGQNAGWDFSTGKSRPEIQGVQKLELIIVQPSKSQSSWNILPSGTMEWRGRFTKFINKLFLRDPKIINSDEVHFGVPFLF